MTEKAKHSVFTVHYKHYNKMGPERRSRGNAGVRRKGAARAWPWERRDQALTPSAAVTSKERALESRLFPTDTNLRTPMRPAARGRLHWAQMKMKAGLGNRPNTTGIFHKCSYWLCYSPWCLWDQCYFGSIMSFLEPHEGQGLREHLENEWNGYFL